LGGSPQKDKQLFDNIKLKVYPFHQKNNTLGGIENLHCYYENTYYGYINNIKVNIYGDSLFLAGSFPKYLQGENMMPLNIEKVRQCIEKLEQDVKLDLKNAVVCQVEFGTSIITTEKPFEYLNLFSYPKKLTRVEYAKWDGVETVLYTSPTGSFEFIGYDKTKEMRQKKQVIPFLFAGSNVLRLEYKIRRRVGIQAKFNRDLFAYDLFNQDVYRTFQNLFLETYKDIDKMGRTVFLNNLEKITPAKIQKLLAEQYRQSFPKEYQYLIQQFKEMGKLSSRNLERIRETNRKLNRNVYISDRNNLIKELDAYIFDIMM